MRPIGEIFIPIGENKHLQKPIKTNGKTYYYRRIYLSRDAANGTADANRQRGYLARVLPKNVWIKKAGYEFGYSKVQGYVLYVNIPQKTCSCGSKKTPFTFGGRNLCSDCAPINIGD